MNHRTQEPEQSGTHIWLRYATQFSVGERSYTVEMGIPVPVGASAEQREQLLREAEAGMGQLTHVVEKRVSQMLRQPPASTTSIASVTPLKAPPAMPQTPQTQQIPQRPIQKPTPIPASHAASPTSSLLSTQTTGREARNETGEHRTVGPRPASATDTTMPAMPRFSVGSEANIPLPDFITAIRDNLNLTPKQAMTMLKVKSLTSINLREALENLQAMIAQGFSDIDQLMAAHPTMQDAANHIAPTVRNAQLERLAPPDQSDQSSQATDEVMRTPSRPLQSNHEAQDYSQPEPVSATVREQSPALNRFDEEINPDEQLEEEELEDLEEPDEDAYGLSDNDRLRAKELLDEMREMRGTHTASAERLKVLNRLVLQQIEPNQLKQLAQGVWGAAPAKLKVDQAEYIINWAKQDDFIGEVEAVLLLLEEESYARGNR